MSIKFLYSPNKIENIEDIPLNFQNDVYWKPFDSRSIEYVNVISREILAYPGIKEFPDLVALGYWFRKTNVSRLEKLYQNNQFRLGRGLAFHIAPGNVDTLFVYSFLLSLLAGNINIIRISQNESEQLNILINIFNKVLSTSSLGASERFIILTYPRDEKYTQEISKYCDLRIIWGSDETVDAISLIPLKPKAVELKFPNRKSYSAINLESLSKLDDIGVKKLAKAFCNDVSIFGQQACSSPTALFFVGNKKLISESERFWQCVQDVQIIQQTSSGIMSRLVSATSMTIDGAISSLRESIKYENISVALGNFKSKTNFRDNHFGDGFIVQYNIESLSDLIEHIEEVDQTLSVFGFSNHDILEFLNSIDRSGIDRIVPIGNALDFNHIWDGFDLIELMSRRIYFNK